MTNNYYISKTEPVRNGDGTNVYFTFSYPDGTSQVNGNVQLTNEEYITALGNGTADDMYTGLYTIIMSKLVTLNTVPTASTSTASTTTGTTATDTTASTTTATA